MRSKRTVVIAILLALLLASVPAQAQEPSVRMIPLDMMAPKFEISPDGQTIALYEDAGFLGNAVNPFIIPIRLFDLATGEERVKLIGPTDYAWDVAFTPDGATLASAHGDSYIYLWDTATGELLKKIPALPTLRTLKFMPDGKTLVCNDSQELLLWDTETTHITHILMHRYPSWEARSFATQKGLDFYISFDISADGSKIAVVTAKENIFLYDLATGEETLLRKAPGDMPTVNIRQLTFMPDGQSVLYFDHVSKGGYWMELDNPAEPTPIPVNRWAFALAPDGSKVSWFEPDEGAVYVMDFAHPDTPTVIPLELIDGLTSQPATVAFTPDGTQIVVTGFMNTDSENAIYVITL